MCLTKLREMIHDRTIIAREEMEYVPDRPGKRTLTTNLCGKVEATLPLAAITHRRMLGKRFIFHYLSVTASVVYSKTLPKTSIFPT